MSAMKKCRRCSAMPRRLPIRINSARCRGRAAQLSDVARCYTDWRQVQEDIETAQMMLDDPEMREMAQEELRDAKEKGDQLEQQPQVLLLPKDPDDERNAFVEVRAGTGGDEAARCLPAICSACTAVTQNAPLAGRDPERQRR